MKKDIYIFRVVITKVLVEHTITQKRMRHRKKMEKHHDEAEMHEVEATTENLEEKKVTE